MLAADREVEGDAHVTHSLVYIEILDFQNNDQFIRTRSVLEIPSVALLTIAKYTVFRSYCSRGSPYILTGCPLEAIEWT